MNERYLEIKKIYDIEIILRYTITDLITTKYLFMVDKYTFVCGNYLFAIGNNNKFIIFDLYNFKEIRVSKQYGSNIQITEIFNKENVIFEKNDCIYLMRYDSNYKLVYGFKIDLINKCILIVDEKHVDFSYSRFVERNHNFSKRPEPKVIDYLNKLEYALSDYMTNIIPAGYRIGDLDIFGFCDGDVIQLFYTRAFNINSI